MRLVGLAPAFLSLALANSAFAQGASSTPPAQSGAAAPRSVGSGITVVPGTAPVAPTSSSTPVAAQPPAASVATTAAPQNAASAAADALARRDEFIRRSVMQSICRGC